MMHIKIFLVLFVSMQISFSVDFRVDYSFDVNDFFGDPADPNDGLKERRDAIEAVAQFFSDLVEDDFLAIDPAEFTNPSPTWTPSFFDPGTGNFTTLPQNTVIPANEVIVFVGGRNLGGSAGLAGPGGFSQASGSLAWIQRVRGRGQANADSGIAADNTDFAPWGGSIAFNDQLSWNFSLTDNLTGFEFVSVAFHEFCHVLGFGLVDSWENFVTDPGDLFTGPAVVNSYGGQPLVQEANINGNHGHFAAPLIDPENPNDPPSIIPTGPAYGALGAAHGTSQRVMMTPSGLDNGINFDVLTDLDVAALIDIGWEVKTPASIDSVSIQSSLITLGWPSSSFVDYQVIRSADLIAPFTDIGGVQAGDGSVMSFEDANTPSSRAFYRIEATPKFPQPNQ